MSYLPSSSKTFARGVVTKLLHNFAEDPADQTQSAGKHAFPKPFLGINIFNSLLGVLYSTYSYLFSRSNKTDYSVPSTIATLSAQILLILVKFGSGDMTNPFREAIREAPDQSMFIFGYCIVFLLKISWLNRRG
jgi:hypothetical protein